MISKIVVDGFRSLSRFELAIKPGLNILVGPNGSGKTNVIEFFQFLSYLVDNEVSRAVSMSGGVGSMLTKVGHSYVREVSAQVYGSAGMKSVRKDSGLYDVRYMYSFRIGVSDGYDRVYFAEQTFRAAFLNREAPSSGDDKWDIDIIQTVANEETAVNVEMLNLSKLEDFSSIRLFVRSTKPSQESEADNPKSEMAAFLVEHGAGERCLLDLLNLLMRDFSVVRSDVAGGEILNIIPSRVKQPEDSAAPAGIRSDGSGLAATLFSLKQQHRAQYQNEYYWLRGQRSRPSPFHRPKAYQQIEQYLQLVNPTIRAMNVENDSFINQIKITFTIEKNNGNILLPITAMSDGTVKWLALITAVLTFRSIFAIEEPENFLHPLMQKEILKIMREDTQRRQGKSFAIMTTHSETLLNAADPEEVVVVSMVGGTTRATRLSDPEILRSEIRATGFGLGFYYISGALDDA